MNAEPRIIVFSCHQTGLSVSCSVKCQSASQLVTQSVFLGMSVYLSACQHILPFLSLLIDFFGDMIYARVRYSVSQYLMMFSPNFKSLFFTPM